MLIRCPRCGVRHDVSTRKPGERFGCPCGHGLEAPKRSGPGWIVILAIVAACAVPCVGILAAIAIPNFIKYQSRSKAMEAKVNLRGLATAERSYFSEHEAYLPVGPAPAQVPGRERVAFPADPGFERLCFRPEGAVRYQYEVRVDEDGSAVVIARGDLDGDGVTSEYRMALPRDGSPGPLEERDPFE